MHCTHRDVSNEHLPVYLDEFVFRHNRRGTPMAAFQTPLGLGAIHDPATYDEITGLRHAACVTRIRTCHRVTHVLPSRSLASSTVPPTDVATAIATRRTHKAYRPEPVPDELVRELLELARWAPNHHLTNPWRFRVIGPEALERLKEAAGPESASKLDRAPTLVVCSC